MKSVLILVISVVSLGVFFMKGEINWTAGLVLSAGSIIGSYVGSRFAVQEKSKVWIFRIIKMVLLVEMVTLILRHQ